jgi:diguanylate cyclase (GGDEF)-like protein/PAS domain S-box-containing protein
MKLNSNVALDHTIFRIALLALAYFLGGKLGLSMPYVGSNITLFWPPTGIALAAIMVWGMSCWPGVFLGAVAINLTTGEIAFPFVLSMAAGNTVGAVLGALILKKLTDFQSVFSKKHDLVVFMLTASGSMLITATIGTLSLYADGQLSDDLFFQAWLGWWLGDTVGVLVFTPLLLILPAYLQEIRFKIRRLESQFIFIMGACAVIAWLVFGSFLSAGPLNLSLAFLVFPPLIWASLRFDILGAAVASLIVSLIAVWGTAHGYGPFSSGFIEHNEIRYDQLVLFFFVTTIFLVSFIVVFVQSSRLDAESRYRALVEQVPAVTYIAAVESYTRNVFVSPQIESQLGYCRDEWLNDPQLWEKQLHPDDRKCVIKKLTDSLEKNIPFDSNYRIFKKNGSFVWVRDAAVWLNDKSDKPRQLQGLMFDITDLKTAEEEQSRLIEELGISEMKQREMRVLAERGQSRMAALLSAMKIGIMFEDNEQRIEFVNAQFLLIWKVNENNSLIGVPTKIVLEQIMKRLVCSVDVSKLLHDALDCNCSELELNDGRVLNQLTYPVSDIKNRFVGRLWVYEDITQERQTAAQLLYLAERDPLTGLFNRHHFQEQLRRRIDLAQRNQERFALLYLDLDDFKFFNDTFGHDVGDTILARVAGEMSSIVRHIEIFARMGDDEFAVLTTVRSMDVEESINALPARIIQAISSIPLHFLGTHLKITGSIGVAVFPDHGLTAEELITHVGTAMYQAKINGKNTWMVYDSKQASIKTRSDQVTWKNRIEQSLERNLFELHFQGIYTVAHNALAHLEVLVRMRDPDAQNPLIMPGQFIPIAEKNGQIINIDRWVIKESIDLLSRNEDLPPLAINISGRTLDDKTVPHFIYDQLSNKKVDPSRLIIELTETAAVSDINNAQRFIEAIHQIGCLVCLDDFGSGFSSFSYLKYLGVKILKIDGIFIQNLHNNRDNQILVKAIVDVAKGLNKITIAEFVEDAGTLDMVRNLGIDLGQGYYLGGPSAEMHSSRIVDTV